jgi:hypothetical protein
MEIGILAQLNFKSLLLGVLLVIVTPFAAYAQCGTQAPGNTFCGNNTGSQGLAGYKPFSSLPFPNMAGGTVLGNPTTITAAGIATTAPVLGIPGTSTGQLGLSGSGSGIALLQAQTAAGSAISLLPTVAGTLVGSATAPLVIGAATGTITCTTCLTTSSFANPSAVVGLAAVNGSATTGMRSDAAPALSQSIAPTMSGLWIFSNATASTSSSTGAVVISTGGLGVGGSINIGASSAYLFSGRSQILSPADGILTLENNAGTAFTRLQFGGTTSSFPAIKRTTTALNIRLADDSADAALTASIATLSNSLVVNGSGTGAATIVAQATAGTPTLTLPNTSGTFAVNASAPLVLSATTGVVSITGSALTESNDTNVTMTLGGSPTTALISATSMTLGWTGTLAVARGGTGGGSASGTLLDNITGFSSTGYLNRTGAGTYIFNAAASNANYFAGTSTTTVVQPNVIYQAETTTTFGTTTTFDFSTFINTAETLTGPVTTQTLTNVKAGQAGTITFIQDATGSRTTVWNSIFKFAGGSTPTLSTAANAVDILSYSCRSATFCVAALSKAVQ